MRELKALLMLPTSLIVFTLLCGADAQELQWPYNLPRTAKYYPEQEAQVKRGLDVEKKLAWQTPVGIKKLGDDPGEKFFLDDWDFGGLKDEGWSYGPQHGDDRRLQPPAHWTECANASNPLQLLPVLAPHTNHNRPHFGLFGRDIFLRSFQCPSGTTSCSSIGESDLCCPNGEACVKTSNGAGCCPSGETCGEEVGSCDTSAGYTSCPNSSNGGCCVPGASCLGDGCVFYGTETVTTTLPAATITTYTTPSSTYIPPPPPPTTEMSPSGYTTTATVTITQGGTTQTIGLPTTVFVSVAVSSTLICSPGFFSCPASLGSGCCQNGQACALNHQCPDISTSTTTLSPNAPVRPTTIAPSPSTETTTATYSGCPTGFYMCSAVYLGGCCREGRNCDTTSCPASDSTNIITSGVTIGAQGVTTTAGSPATGTCAGGWYSCSPSDGGGCCPSGYLCSSSCVATVSGVSDQPKEVLSGANGIIFAWSFLALSGIAAFGMVLL